MSGPKSDKIWADEIHKAVKEYHEQTTPEGEVKKVRKLRLLATNLVDAGINGDMAAIKEIGLRLDGPGDRNVNVNRTSTTIIEHRGLPELLEALGIDAEREADAGDKAVVH